MLISFADVQPEPTRWVWENWVALQNVSILNGLPGSGKSTFLSDLAAKISTGYPLPGCDAASIPPSPVLFISREDNLSSKTVPNTRAALANDEIIFNEDAPLALPRDMSLLTKQVEKVRPRLLVIDPVSKYFFCSSERSVRAAIDPLVSLAREADLALLLVRHIGRTARTALYAGAGSIALTGEARSEMMIGTDPANPDRKVLAHQKTNNNGPLQESISFRLKQSGPATTLEWLGPSTCTAEDLVRSAPERDRPAFYEACDFLFRMLCHGPVPASTILQKARFEGIKEHTLRRAKQHVANDFRKGFGPGSKHYWELKDDKELPKSLRERALSDYTDELFNATDLIDDDDERPSHSDGFQGIDPDDPVDWWKNDVD